MLNQVTAWMEAENIQNLPGIEVFPIVAEVGAAFRHLAPQGKNVGKVVLSFPLLSESLGEKAQVPSPMADYSITASREPNLRVAEWLVEQGVRHLILSGTPPAIPRGEQSC